MDFVKDVAKKAEYLRGLLKDSETLSGVSSIEALNVAVLIQRNELYAESNVLRTGFNSPSALEQIAIELKEIASKQ